ncbi:Heparan-alpha-glucosaminide N-acetyltransferase [Nymphaea thermarum]|nr:Heparan-alpha-glucosaminide N-acetyltransferase [Nymphaea thermarum]
MQTIVEQLMILVDDAGGAFPCINHSPWFGITLADVVMPFFLFIVGLSVGLVFKNVSNKPAATQKVGVRFIKLFLLGLLLQGGYFHGLNNLTYGVNVRHIRWLGVLQRISIGYLVVSLAEIWLVGDMTVDSFMAFVKKYSTQWILMVLLSLTYVSLLYGLYVPNWEFEIMYKDAASNLNGTIQAQTVECGFRGSLGPPCNAAGFIDRLLLGENHLYQHPVYRRTKECSVNSPDYGPLPPKSPRWCLAPFDPEGILSSFMAIVTCFIGLHYAHIIVSFKVDVKDIRWPTLLLQWVGMNALLVYALVACDLFAAALQGFYWRSPQNNLVNATELLFETLLHSSRWGKLVFVLVEILFWCIISALLHMKGIYWKM